MRYPIIQAPIGSATSLALAASVSAEGGLGTLAITWRDPRKIARDVALLARRYPGTFAVNVVLTSPQDERVATALGAGARILWTAWGDPGAYVSIAHRASAMLMHTVGSVREAEDAARAGVDAIVVQGVDAGGHVCSSSPWEEMLSAIRARCPAMPIAVAGGIADGGDIARALAAGADAACLGTRFLCTPESNASPGYRARVVKARATDTILTTLFDKGWPNAPHRVIRNHSVDMWEAAGCPPPGARPGERDIVATASNGLPVERYSDVIPTRSVLGSVDDLALYAGTTVARITDVVPARALMQRLIRQMGSAWR